jgi:DNA invertase Pin-like site-specific DNA recombinase
MIKVEVKQGIIIARVSTEEQAKEGHYSIPVQVSATKKYAEKKGIDVPDDMIFELKGESAFKGKRKKFKKAIQKATTVTEETNKPV